MTIENKKPQQFEPINFLPLVLFTGLIIFNENNMWPSSTVRIIYGIIFLVSFYGISILMIFSKQLQKGRIVFLIIPFTAVFMYWDCIL